MTAAWHRVCRADELAEGAALSRVVHGVAVGLVRTGGRVVAFGALCPHQRSDLTEGIVEDGGITCPTHLWHFELSGGACTMVPGYRVPLYPVQEVSGWITVDVRQ